MDENMAVQCINQVYERLFYDIWRVDSTLLSLQDRETEKERETFVKHPFLNLTLHLL